ncbi:MAG: hypothetical protein P1U58_05305 [Verrucomicrobiales bacterium]|nr:hypothetical protein [Verrucomicrobiales bacterium]
MKEPVKYLTKAQFSGSLVIAITIFAGLGVFASSRESGTFLNLFHLDRELNFTTLFSAFLLVANGWFLYRIHLLHGPLPAPIRFLGFIFLFMGADECLKIHETAERLTGIDWQLLYLPLIAAAGFGWLRFAITQRGLQLLLWILGAVAWGSSQLLEAVQWNWGGGIQIANYLSMMIGEEILEMSGSACFLVTLFDRLKHGAENLKENHDQPSRPGFSRSMKTAVR